jgi:hypothetical protein
MYSLQNHFGLQDPHTDLLGIIKAFRVLIPGVNLAYSCILALEDDTFVYVYDNDDASKEPIKIHIPKGYLFIFAGDVIHCGMNSPGHDNMRAHIILKTKEFSAGGNVQGWLKASGIYWVYKVGCDHVDEL